MSTSTPQCFLFCSRCKAVARKHPNYYRRDFKRDYLSVRVVGALPGGALCVCEKCKYRYKSNSMAAKRALRRITDAQPGARVDYWATCEDCGQHILTPQAGKRVFRNGQKYSRVGWVNVHRGKCPSGTPASYFHCPEPTR